MLKDFKEFILRGSVIDLAIGVAIGAAFTTVVNSFTKNLLTPLIAIPGSAASLADKKFTISGSEFRYGSFIDDIISFVIIAAVLFFFVVKPVNALMNRRKTEPDVDSTVKECPRCLSKIPAAAQKCAFCTADLAAV